MRVVLVAVVTALALMVGAGSALAKGASAATIEGPGGGSPTSIGGETMARLADSTGFFPAVYGEQAGGSPLNEAPAGDLGMTYTIRWTVPGPDGDDAVLIQRLYPDAVGGPVTYLAPGQPFWGSERTVGGWRAGDGALADVLAEIDLPPPPSPSRPNLMPVTIVVLLAAGGAAVVARRGRRRSPALPG